MKASQYKEAHRRLKYSGLYTEIPDAEKSAILSAWDGNTDTLGRAESFLAKGREKHVDNILLVRGVDIAEVPAKKLYAHLNRGISFGKLVVILERSLGAHSRAVQVAEELFIAVDRIPPVPRELHEQMLKTQEEHLPERLKPNEAGFHAKEWVKAQLRPIMKRPLAVAVQQHLKEVKQLNDEAEQRQSFLPDGRLAGIQHVLAERAAKNDKGGTIKRMTDAAEGADAPKPLAQIKTKLLSLGKTEPQFAQYEVMVRDIVSNKTQVDLKVPGVFVYPVGVRKVKETDGTITLHFKGEKIVFSKKEHSKLLELLGLPPLSDATENKEAVFTRALDAAVKALSKDISVESELRDLITNTGASDSQRDVLSRGIKEAKDGFVNILTTGERLADDDFSVLKQLLENGASLPASASRIEHLAYRAFSAVVQAYRELHEPKDPRLSGLAYATPLDAEKKDDEATKYRPGLIKKILHDGKKYKNDAEKQLSVELLALPDGAGKTWGRFTFTISTDTTTGLKTYTYTDRSATERTFNLSAEEQKKLRDTEVESSADPEKEKKERAVREMGARYTEFLALKKPVADDKKELIAIFEQLLVDNRERKFVYKLDGSDVVLVRGQDRENAHIYLNSEKKSERGTRRTGESRRFEIAKIKDQLRALDNADKPKMPAELKTALDVLPGWDKTKYFDNDAQRAVLDKYLKPLFDSAHRPAKIGDFDVTDISHTIEFSKDGKPAFPIRASQVALWKDISAVPKPPEPPRLPPSDALPAGVLEQSIVGTDGWEDELGRRIGTKLLMGKLKMEQGQISKEKALDYVKGLGFWKRMVLYAGLALVTAGAAVATAGLFSAIAPYYLGGWGAAWSAKWFGMMGLKIALGATAGLTTNWLARKHILDKYWGIAGADGKQISFFERSKDAAGYYRALNEFRKSKKEFDSKERSLAKARNYVRAAGTPEFVAAKYQMGMDTVMAHHEKGARNERTRQFLIPIAIGGGIAGATAYYHWDIIKSLMPGSRPPSGALPPTTGRGGPPPLTRGGQPPVPQGPRYVQDRFGRWILPNSGQYIEVYCGAPRASCIPCDFTINGTRAHWYINSFADSMSVASPKGGMSHLLGNMNTIPGGRATQEQVWSLFERTLCADRDLYRTFYNVGNSSKGKWIDFAVLKETTWIGGRKQTMIDVMIDRAGNENVRSTLRAMRESIIQNNPRLSVRLAR